MHQQNRLYSCGSMKVLALLFALFFAVTTACFAEKKPSVNDVFSITGETKQSVLAAASVKYMSKLEVTHNVSFSAKETAVNIEFTIKNKCVSDIVISEKDVRASCKAGFQRQRIEGIKEISYGFGVGEILRISGKFPVLLKAGESATFCVTKDLRYYNRYIVNILIFKEIDYSVDFKRKKPIITAVEGDTAIKNAEAMQGR